MVRRGWTIGYRAAALTLTVGTLLACGDGSGGDATDPEATDASSDRTYVPEQGTKTATVNGIEIAYFDDGSGPLVILLHGFPDTPHTWDGIAPRLNAAGYRTVSPFLRGYSPSGIPATDQTIEDLGADVIGLMDALGASDAILIGHDVGAIAAYAAASLDPARVTKLVTMSDPHPIAIFQHPEVPLPDFFGKLAASDAEATYRADDFALLDAFISRELSPTWSVPEGQFDPAKNAFTPPGSFDAALGFFRTVRTVPPEIFQPLPMPNMTFHGTAGGGMPTIFYESQAAAFTGPFELVQLPVGHFIHLEAEDEVLNRILAFLSQ